MTVDQSVPDPVLRDRGLRDPVSRDAALPNAALPNAALPHDGEPGDGVHGDVASALDDDERAARLGALTDLIDMIRPAVQADGGDLALVHADVETGVVEVQLQGSCSSCAVSSTTLQAGVSRILRDRLEWVTEVSGGVDESMDFEVSASMGRGGYVPR